MHAAMRLAAPLAIAMLAACGAPAEKPAPAPPLQHLDDLLAEQASLYGLMEPQDLYKLLHQAVKGPSNVFLGDHSHLDTGLAAEIARIDPLPSGDEPEFEVLDPARHLVRVNLRPYLKRGGTADDLARAVGRTAHVFRGEDAVLEATLDAAADRVPQLALGFSAREFRDVAATMKARGYPAGRHSMGYGLAYAPAYRIVQRQFLE